MEDLDKDTKLRLTALDRAIESGCGQGYDETGKVKVNAYDVVIAAKKFEAYLKGTGNEH